MKFNINDYVKVKLTDKGRELHKRYQNELLKHWDKYEYKAPKEDEDGWSKWQLWDLMQTFGPHIHLGGINPFDTEIEIITNDTK